MKIGPFDEVCIINNKEEFAQLVQQTKDHGYHMQLNPLWEEEVKNGRRTEFVDAKNHLQQTLKLDGILPRPTPSRA
ncbi:hypothetical protein ACUHMQ_13050 [Chitinimonas sp. PSY-7]|uniref:hypothetical protein n=1 Tax=Chitinimonas sp. PSY-7 TaxID=3459088 RepID=UPI00404002DC